MDESQSYDQVQQCFQRLLEENQAVFNQLEQQAEQKKPESWRLFEQLGVLSGFRKNFKNYGPKDLGHTIELASSYRRQLDYLTRTLRQMAKWPPPHDRVKERDASEIIGFVSKTTDACLQLSDLVSESQKCLRTAALADRSVYQILQEFEDAIRTVLVPDVLEPSAALPFVLQHQRLLEDALQRVATVQRGQSEEPVIHLEGSVDSPGIDSASCGAKSVPIPESLPNQLQEAIKQRGHTQEKACEEMDCDRKTLRKLLTANGKVHQATLNKVRVYIDSTTV